MASQDLSEVFANFDSPLNTGTEQLQPNYFYFSLEVNLAQLSSTWVLAWQLADTHDAIYY